MINAILKSEEKSIKAVEEILQNGCCLSRWEKIKTISICERKFIFTNKIIDVDLYRKFSVKNGVEKYALKSQDDKVLAVMDLKIYKDSVYIINLQVPVQNNYEKFMQLIIQTAVEKSMYNTTNKEVYINLTDSFFTRNKTKKIITSCGFTALNNQSDYEKNLFGEAFMLKTADSVFWQERIKKLQMLIDK